VKEVQNIVLVILAGIELNLFPVAAAFWIWYEKNVDNTQMFPAVAKKSLQGGWTR